MEEKEHIQAKKTTAKAVSKPKSGPKKTKSVPKKAKTVRKTAKSVSKAPQPETSEEETKAKKTGAKRDASGRFVKGTKKLPGSGKKMGSKNVSSGSIRDKLKEIVMPYLNGDVDAEGNTLAKDLQKIDDPKDRADIITKYLPFIVPKFSSTTISADANRPVSEEERLVELDNEYKKSEMSISIKTLTVIDNDNAGASAPLTKEELEQLNDCDDDGSE